MAKRLIEVDIDDAILDTKVQGYVTKLEKKVASLETKMARLLVHEEEYKQATATAKRVVERLTEVLRDEGYLYE